VEGKAYRAGPGVAITGEDLLELALAEAGADRAAIVPIEATAVAGMALLKEVGAVTISVSGMPGSACVYRLMSYPDGERLGKDAIIHGTRHAISTVAKVLADRDVAAEWILG
jgi:L-seryl-tRNA(Ser) seleniumtransferase